MLHSPIELVTDTLIPLVIINLIVMSLNIISQLKIKRQNLAVSNFKLKPSANDRICVTPGEFDVDCEEEKTLKEKK